MIAALSAVATATKAEAAEAERCSDCAMLADQMPVPESFDRKTMPGYLEMVRQSVHDLAIREQISHSEAGLRVYWQALPTMVEMESPPDVSSIAGVSCAHYTASLREGVCN
jgi:hypothetical protein